MFGRVLITGGAGLIGSHIVDALAGERVTEIVVFDDFSRGSRENLDTAVTRGRVRIVEGALTDVEAVKRAMEGVSVVFHQAAIRIPRCAAEPRLAKDVLVDGTFNVLEAAVIAGVQKVVAASSASVYGLAEQFPTHESHHGYANRTIYGAAKMFNEGLLRSFNEMYGLDYVALRYFNVYGPRMDMFGAYTEVLVRWIEAIEDGRPPVIFGDGTDTMDFVHVEDVARANVLAAKSNVTDAVFNVATGVETSLNDLAAMLLRLMGSMGQPVFAPARKINAIPRRVASIEAAQRCLGFRSEISLEQGLISLVDWWRRQRSVGTR